MVGRYPKYKIYQYNLIQQVHIKLHGPMCTFILKSADYMGTHIFFLFMIKPTICEDLRLFIFKLLIVLSTSSVARSTSSSTLRLVHIAASARRAVMNTTKFISAPLCKYILNCMVKCVVPYSSLCQLSKLYGH